MFLEISQNLQENTCARVPFTFYASNSSSCKHNYAVFYQHRNPFNFVLDIFCFISLHGKITEETCTFSLKSN